VAGSPDEGKLFQQFQVDMTRSIYIRETVETVSEIKGGFTPG